MAYYLGIDIGGTKTAIGLFDENLNLLVETAFATEASLGYESLLDRILKASQTLASGREIISCGVACPGPLDIPSGKIVAAPTLRFYNKPLRNDLSSMLAIPVYLENDANSAALYESQLGWGRGLGTVVYITVSTGVGCGIVVNGRILDGGASSAGELGHLVIERNGGIPCSCGGSGCLEAYVAGPAIAKRASEKYGKAIDPKEVFRLAAKGDITARLVVDEVADYLGYAVAAVYQIIDPDIVVFGGSVMKDYEVIENALLNAVKRYSQNIPGRKIRIEVTQSPNPALMGAVCLCRQ